MIAGTVKAGSRVQFSGQDLVSPRYCAGHQGWVELCKHCGAQGRPAGCHRLYTGRPYCAPSREQVGHNAVAQRCHKTLLPLPGTHITAVAISTHKDKIGLWARSLKSVLVLPAQILGPFGPPKCLWSSGHAACAGRFQGPGWAILMLGIC